MQRSDINKITNLYESCKLKDFIPLAKIAAKHNCKLSVAEKALEKGTEVEYEHTKDKKTAETIASHHLFELIDYYDKLEKMEKSH